MKNKIAWFGTTLTLAAGLVLGFQNCSGGSLPNVDQTSQTAGAAANSAPLDLLYTPSLVTGTTQYVQATGGTGSYKYSLVSGPGAIDATNGLFTAGTVAGSSVIQVSDGILTKQGMITITGAVNSVPAITPGTLTVTGTQTFNVPAFNTLTIEVYGAGGGGGALTFYVGGLAGPGTAGGASAVNGGGVAIVANGGRPGAPGGVNYVNGAPGAGGTASGGSDANVTGAPGSGANGGRAAGPEGGAGGLAVLNAADGGYYPTAGGLAGGGGAGFGYSIPNVSGFAGGGGGGGYAKSTFTGQAAMPIGTTLTLSIGAAGSAGLDGGGRRQAADGAPGKIKISWN